MKGADCHTDHIHIRSNLSLVIEPRHKIKSQKPAKKLNLAKIKSPEVESALQEAIEIALDSQPQYNTSELEWKRIKEATFKAAFDTSGLLLSKTLTGLTKK